MTQTYSTRSGAIWHRASSTPIATTTLCVRATQAGRVEKAGQGVATLVVGNCSFSLYPTVPRSTELLRQHFSALLGETTADEVFESFAAYREALHRRGT